MSIMKKIAAVLSVATALCMLTSCGKQEEKTTLTMATNAEFPPYEFHDEGNIVGIDVEIAQAIADDMGAELVIEDMAFDSVIASVQTGKVDIGLAGLTVNEERLVSVDFTDSYTTAAQVIIVKEDSPIASPDDLKNKAIGVQNGTTGAIYAEDIEGVNLNVYSKGYEAVQALSQDKLDAVIIDREPAKALTAQLDGMKILDEEFTNEDYAIAVKKGNTELKDEINATLKKLKDSGKLDEIIAKYIPAE